MYEIYFLNEVKQPRVDGENLSTTKAEENRMYFSPLEQMDQFYKNIRGETFDLIKPEGSLTTEEDPK